MAGILLLTTGGCVTADSQSGSTDPAAENVASIDPATDVEPETATENQQRKSRAEVQADRYAEAVALQQTEDHEAAFAAFQRLAEEGHAAAAFDYAQALDSGDGTPRDEESAALWYAKAAALGSPRALYLQGLTYANGVGVEKDLDKAARSFAEAARLGHAEAQLRLGRAYANGEGVDRDVLWATRWYDRAAVQGNADAQFAYAVQLASGANVPLDLPLAAALMEAAQQNGHSLAGQILPKIQSRLSPSEHDEAALLLADLYNSGPPGIQDRPTVRYVQKALGLLGIDVGAVDGWMGDNTRDGIRTFQERAGMTPDGAVTDDLLDKLRGTLLS